ncbi:MAG TPA: hypothetical protein VNA69_05610 [Thermoanaerobaculia bacterium]|nr:hypothetical protein [Thermoanaerobaculia bacterium]
MNTAFLGFLRGLGFGGFLGGGVAGALHLFVFRHLGIGVGFTETVVVGGLLGAGASRAVERFSSTFFGPVSKAIEHYSKMAELNWQIRRQLIDDGEASRIKNELTRSYFLGSKAAATKQIGFSGGA